MILICVGMNWYTKVAVTFVGCLLKADMMLIHVNRMEKWHFND